MGDNEERTKRGKDLLAKLTGGPAAKATSPLPQRLSDYTVNFVFGEVWSGPELTLQERSMATCAALIAMNRINEMKAHFAAARNLDIPREKIEGLITHLAVYAGWPCAV